MGDSAVSRHPASQFPLQPTPSFVGPDALQKRNATCEVFHLGQLVVQEASFPDFVLVRTEEAQLIGHRHIYIYMYMVYIIYCLLIVD